MNDLKRHLEQLSKGSVAVASYNKSSDYNLGSHDGQVRLAKWVLDQLEVLNIEVSEEEVVIDEDASNVVEPVVRLSQRPTMRFRLEEAEKSRLASALESAIDENDWSTL